MPRLFPDVPAVFYFLGVDNGRPYGGIGDVRRLEVTGKSLLMPLDQWHHLAFVYNDSLDSMYMHYAGTGRASAGAARSATHCRHRRIHGRGLSGYRRLLVGIIDDVAVYDAALSSAAIRQLYETHTHPDLTASYYFNGDAADASGNGHDGAIHGATFAADRFGNPNRALSFDGNDYVLVSDHTDLRFDQRLHHHRLDQRDNPWPLRENFVAPFGKLFYFLGVDNGNPYGGIGDGSGGTVTGKSIDMPLDQWHFIAFVYDSPADSMHIYYDGILDQTTVLTSLPAMPGVDLAIGGEFQGTANFFEGLIDGVAIYDQALTAEEIRESYSKEGFEGRRVIQGFKGS